MPLTPRHTFAAAALVLAGLGAWAVLAWRQENTAVASAPPPAAAIGAPRQQPMILAPAVEGLWLCDAARNNPRVQSVPQAREFCRQRGEDGAPALARLLDAMEPGGPVGEVQLGYTLTLPLLELYREGEDGTWVLDEGELDARLGLIAKVARPVVLYLQAGHFDSQGPIAQSLGRDADNLMQLSDGQPLRLQYFDYAIMPWTLSAEPGIAVNRHRFQALERVAQKIRQWPQEVQARIVAYTLVGELHHLFPDFTNGVGEWQNVRVTDYSPRSQAGFGRWLQEKYGDAAAWNARHGLDVPDFGALAAPHKNLRQDARAAWHEHYDAWADGLLPIAGWLWDPQQAIGRLDVYLDGRWHASMARGLHRLDVYRALEEVTDPNVGFRHDLDFSPLPPGAHVVQVLAEVNGKKHQMARVDFAVAARPGQPAPVEVKRPRHLGWLPTLDDLPGRGVRAWLDLPFEQPQTLYFNPLARDWNAWRQSQVHDFLHAFYQRALNAGLPAEKLFSHQIVPEVNSSWNEKLLASSSTLDGQNAWRPGFNLYGGATHNAWLRAWLRQRGIAGGYGVPEFHPQQWKTPGAHLAALQSHLDAGARFVAPYYFTLIDARFTAGTEEHGVNRMEIAPDNAKDGSDQLYRAMVEMARK